MKTITDYITYAMQSIAALCIPFKGGDCTDCKLYDYCRVNSTLLAVDMMIKAGEYH